MAMPRRRRPRYHYLSTLTAFTFLLFFYESTSTVPPVGNGIQDVKEKETVSGMWDSGRLLTQKRLGGPGSSPPSCRSKCGRCSPCKPVHVPVQPGMRMPMEYYPEAWRCNCGNKLFMP